MVGRVYAAAPIYWGLILRKYIYSASPSSLGIPASLVYYLGRSNIHFVIFHYLFSLPKPALTPPPSNLFLFKLLG